jgi:hypothetical protein
VHGGFCGGLDGRGVLVEEGSEVRCGMEWRWGWGYKMVKYTSRVVVWKVLLLMGFV